MFIYTISKTRKREPVEMFSNNKIKSVESKTNISIGHVTMKPICAPFMDEIVA